MSRPDDASEQARLLEHVRVMRGLARSLLRDEHLAEDVVQDTLVRAIERPPRPWNVRGWLRVVTRNVALRRRREEDRRKRRERHAARSEAVPGSSEVMEHLEVHRRLIDAVLGLPEHYRAVIVHRYFENRGRAEIARILDVPPETVKTRLRRALVLLREQLDHGEEGTAGGGWCVALACLLRRNPLGRVTASLYAAKHAMLPVAITLASALVGGAYLLAASPGHESHPRDGRRLEASAVVGDGPGREAGVADEPARRARLEVEGVVRDASGNPIAGARVQSDARAGPVLTNALGRFRLSSGEHPLAVFVQADGYVDWRGALDPLHGSAHDVVLRRGVPLSARLLDPNRRPVVDARAEAYVVERKGVSGMWESRRVARLGGGVSDAEGRVRFGNAPSGHLEIRVRDERFAWTSYGIDVLGPDPVEVEIVLTRGGTITGRVLDPDGRPVAGARVYAGSSRRRDARSDEDGFFRLERVPVGAVEIFAEADGFGAGYFGSALGWGKPVPVRVAPGQLVTGIDVALGPAWHVSGRVVDDVGRAVPGALVRSARAPGGGDGVRTDERGCFLAGPLRSGRGTVTLSLEKEGYARRTLDVAPRDVGVHGVGVVRMPRLGSVRGVVLDVDGLPLDRGRVRVSAGGRAVLVGPDGRFSIAGIEPGRVHLTAEADEPARRSRPRAVEIEPGRARTVELELASVASIRGRVVSPLGEPRPGVLVGALPVVDGRPLANECRRVRTRDDGSFVFAGLPGGTWVVGAARPTREEAATPGTEIPFPSGPTSIRMVLPGMEVDAPGGPLAQAPAPVRVRAGQGEVTLCLPFRGSIVRGRVVSRETGRPIGTYDLSFIRFRRFIPRQVVSTGVRDDPEGAFAQELPATGLWTAEIKAPGHAVCRIPLLRSDPGDRHELGTIVVGRGGRLRGTVRDVHGEPVAYARIHLMSDCLQDSDRPIFTDADGEYDAPALAAGEYTVFALSPRHPLGVVKDVVIRDRQTTELHVALGPASPVTLVVSDGQGQPVAGAEVVYAGAEVWPLDSRLLRSYEPPGWGGWRTDDEGLLRKPYLPATRVFFMVRADGFAPAEKAVDLAAGRPERIEIRMSRR